MKLIISNFSPQILTHNKALSSAILLSPCENKNRKNLHPVGMSRARLDFWLNFFEIICSKLWFYISQSHKIYFWLFIKAIPIQVLLKVPEM